jgi:hypothetical protein
MDGGSIGGTGSTGSSGSSAVPTATQGPAVQPASGAQPVADGPSGGQEPQVGGIDGGGGASKPPPTPAPEMNTEHFCALQQQAGQHKEDQGIDLKKLMEIIIALKMMEAMGGGE